MSHITLTEEQLRAIGQTAVPITVYGPDNQPIGSLTLLTAEEQKALQRHRQRGGEPRSPAIPGARVQAFLQQLHEMERQGNLDETAVREALARLKAGEPA